MRPGSPENAPVLRMDRRGNLQPLAGVGDVKLLCSEGLLGAFDSDSADWGFINMRGEWVIPPRYQDVEIFSEGVAVVYTGSKHPSLTTENTASYINHRGQIALQRKFGIANPFTNGRAIVCTGQKEWAPDGLDTHCTKYGILTRNWKIMQLPAAVEVTGWSAYLGSNAMSWGYARGLLGVQRGKRYGFLDTSGRLVIPAVFKDPADAYGSFACNQRLCMDRKGRVIVRAAK